MFWLRNKKIIFFYALLSGGLWYTYFYLIMVYIIGNPKGFLLASDVAARGLDIPNVEHVIHYQVPHTVEVS